MATTDARTTNDVIRDAEAFGSWLLIEFPDDDTDAPRRFAYRPIYHVLPDRWIHTSPSEEDAHIAPTESVQTLVSHDETSVSLVDEPPFGPGEADA